LNRKASATVHAVDERQALEKLTRDEKTAQRLLTQLQDKQSQLEQRKQILSQDAKIQEDRKAEVISIHSL
jgi:structural maintenance of chromosome 1